MYPQGSEILVVDHEPKRRERVARLLAAEGFAVTEASEGLTALRVCADRRYALIVAAVDLPGSLDGAATLRRVRLRQPWVKALYTGEPSSRPATGNLHIDDFIAAPFERFELIGCIFELMHRIAADEVADLARSVRAERKAS